ncbi:MAG: ABC transporter permease [Candidatus Cyclobacteriaceae bacterium M2_1C_046]
MIKKFADWLLQGFCHPDFFDEIHGDLEELYHRNKERRTYKSQLTYLFQVIMLFRPSLIRPLSKIDLIQQSMFRNYLKISSRNLLRYKLFTAINILGLVIGLSSFLLINEYVNYEKSYDQFYKGSENIYRLSTVQYINGEIGVKDAMTFHPAARSVKEEIAGVSDFTVTFKFNQIYIRKGESVIEEDKVISADSSFFEVFDHRIISGSKAQMLSGPDQLVLTRSKAKFYFGDKDPVGETLELLGSFNRTFKVTGVIEDIPENTHYKYNIIMSDESIKDRGDYDKWNAFNYYSYLKVEDDLSVEAINDQLIDLSVKYLGENTNNRFYVFPAEDLHLHSDFTFEAEIPGSAKAVKFLMIISLFILLIAWINYINLSTARAVNRAKEVGIRKVIGAYKGQLITQFLMEALLVNLLASMVALLTCEMLAPFFNQLVGKEVLTNVWNHPSFLTNLLIFFIIGTIVSGFYPAMVLSGFKPVLVLKGKFKSSKGGSRLRKGLVIIQFAASIILIAATFTVYRQLNFIQGRDLGISTDYVVGFELPQVSRDQRESHNSKVQTFKNVLSNHNAIETVGGTSSLPGGGNADISSSSGKVRIVGKTDKVPGTTYLQYIDDQYLNAVDMQLLAGRNFDRKRTEDSLVIMVNEAFFTKFNITDKRSMLNERIQFGDNDKNRKFEIIGIVKDFNRTSLRSTVEPTVFVPQYSSGNIAMELNPDSYREGLIFLEKTWKEFFPDTPLSYSFLDDRFASLYEQDQRFGKVFGTFAVLAIFIATLGLFGLSSFMAVQRTVEVGVRKVLGASVINIITIFFKEFLILLLVAGIVSIPLIYFAMSEWLSNYAYRIEFPWLFSFAALAIVVVFALSTVGYQIYKVAILDPVKTLKDE